MGEKGISEVGWFFGGVRRGGGEVQRSIFVIRVWWLLVGVEEGRERVG